MNYSSIKETIIIIILAAIWGASFLFMRILVPHLTPISTANLRILIAGISVFAIYYFSGRLKGNLSADWKKYLIAGVFNSAIPFVLYCFASQYLPAGYSSILNALTPLFTALLSIFYLKNPLTKDKLMGLILGFIGVLILMWPKIINSSIIGIMPILAMLACIGATICYAVGSTYAKKSLSHCSSESLAAYTQIFAGVCMLPLWIFNMPVEKLIHVIYTPKLIFSLLSIAIFCSGLSYILYFSLIRTAGTIKATSTTFLIPFFGILWAYIFLGEEMPHTAYISLIFIVISSILVLRPDKKTC